MPQEQPSSDQSQSAKQGDPLLCAQLKDVDHPLWSLLESLTTENFATISAEVVKWANKSEDEKDARTLRRIAQLIVRKAASLEAKESKLYVRLCHTLFLRISKNIRYECFREPQDVGGRLFWIFIARSFVDSFDPVDGRCKCHQTGSVGETSCRLAQARFFGELFIEGVFNEYFVRAVIERLLANVASPKQEDLETVCELLKVVGSALDKSERRQTMDGYIERMRAMDLKLTTDRSLSVDSMLRVSLCG